MDHQQQPSDTPVPPLTNREVFTAADAAFSALRAKGFTHACLFGSAACSLYGMRHRVPRDVDLVVFNTDLGQDAFKHTIHSADTRFLLVSSQNSGNMYEIAENGMYKILWYTVSSSPPRYCKVDVLIPGLLGIPSVPWDDIVLRSHATFRLPVMPLFPLLLLKLCGWEGHRNTKAMFRKISNDRKDIDEVLAIAVDTQARAAAWLSEAFMVTARARAREFVKWNHNFDPKGEMTTRLRISQWVTIGVSDEAILQADLQERMEFIQEQRDRKAAKRVARQARREARTEQSAATSTTATKNAATASTVQAGGLHSRAATATREERLVKMADSRRAERALGAAANEEEIEPRKDDGNHGP